MTAAALSKTRIVFARSSIGIMDLNPTRGMKSVCVCVYSVFVLSCV
jgi:hypothetical protein